MKFLRIIFTILCAVCIAAVSVVGIFGGMDYIGIPLIAAGVFFLLMIYCKNKQLAQEEKQTATPTGDFLNPLTKTEETASSEQPIDENVESKQAGSESDEPATNVEE